MKITLTQFYQSFVDMAADLIHLGMAQTPKYEPRGRILLAGSHKIDLRGEAATREQIRRTETVVQQMQLCTQSLTIIAMEHCWTYPYGKI
jgi:hypothetical protein